jgi:hypothetical protein
LQAAQETEEKTDGQADKTKSYLFLPLSWGRFGRLYFWNRGWRQ